MVGGQIEVDVATMFGVGVLYSKSLYTLVSTNWCQSLLMGAGATKFIGMNAGSETENQISLSCPENK